MVSEHLKFVERTIKMPRCLSSWTHGIATPLEVRMTSHGKSFLGPLCKQHDFMAALRNRWGHYIFVLWFLLSSFFSSPNLSRRRLDVCHTYTQVGCRSEMCCTRLTENTGPKKFAIWAPSRNFVRVCLCNLGMYWQSKKLVKQQCLPPHVLTTWWTLALLAALLNGTLIVGVSQTAALYRWHHLYSAGQPSHLALAHISSCEYGISVCDSLTILC